MRSFGGPNFKAVLDALAPPPGLTQLFLALALDPDQLRADEAAFDCVETSALYGDRSGAKLQRVQSVAGPRPLAWLALEPPSDAHRWAARRTGRARKPDGYVRVVVAESLQAKVDVGTGATPQQRS